MRLLPTPHLFRAHLAHPGGSGTPSPPPSIPSGSRLTFIRFSTSTPAHTSASFPAGSHVRFKRPRAASNAATLSILFKHSCSLSPPFRPVPRGLSARVRRRTRPFSAHSGHLSYFLVFVHSLFVRMALLTFWASCILLLLCSHFPGTLLSHLFSLFSSTFRADSAHLEHSHHFQDCLVFRLLFCSAL